MRAACAWIFVLCSGLLHGGMQNVDCRNPYVFSGARFNAVIVPYQYVGTNSSLERSLAAQRVGLILQREVLHSLLVYNSVAAVQLMKPAGGSNCDADRVASQLMGTVQGALTRMRADHSLAILSGILYEEKDDLYLRSFLRLYRNKIGGEEIPVKLGTRTLSAPSAVEAVAFPPVHIRKSDLNAIEAAFRRSSRVYKTRSATSPVVEIPFDPRHPFGYTVVESANGWTRIREIDGDIQGWMQEAPDAGADGNLLRNRMPELQFLVAAAGYLLSDVSPPAGIVARRKIDELLRANTDPDLRAAVLALSAQLRLRRDITIDEYRVAVQEVEQAYRHDQANARLQNFAAACRAWLLFKQAGSYDPNQIANDLKDAAARTSDPRLLQNLRSLYEAMLEPNSTIAPQDPAAIQAELQVVRKLVASGTQ